MTKYVVVGDSQAEGILFANALPALLGDDLVGQYDHRGWSSARLLSDGAIATAAARAADQDATLLVFAGGNDNNVLASAESEARYRQTLRDIVKTIARKSAAAGVTIRVVWFGPVFALEPWNAEQHPQAQRVQRSALSPSAVRRDVAEIPGASVSLRWIDSFPLTRDLARVENVHLTAADYRVFAERALHAASGGGAGSLLMLGFGLGAGWWAWRKWGRR